MSQAKVHYGLDSIVLFVLLLSSCKDNSLISSTSQLDLSKALQEAGITGVDLRNSSSTISTTLLSLSISSPSISGSVSGNVKVMEKFDSPVVNIEKQDITFIRSIPKNAKITRVYKKYKDGRVVTEETEITEPKTLQETVIKPSNLPSWLATFLLSLTYVVGIIIFIRKKIFKKK